MLPLGGAVASPFVGDFCHARAVSLASKPRLNSPQTGAKLYCWHRAVSSGDRRFVFGRSFNSRRAEPARMRGAGGIFVFGRRQSRRPAVPGRSSVILFPNRPIIVVTQT